MITKFMESTLEATAGKVSPKNASSEEKRYISFAEQYFETPVYEGRGVKSYEMAKFTATACTFKGIPIWDDF